MHHHKQVSCRLDPSARCMADLVSKISRFGAVFTRIVLKLRKIVGLSSRRLQSGPLFFRGGWAIK